MSNNFTLSICHYPTECMLVDDDELFIEPLQLLIRTQVPCDAFVDPRSALAKINDTYKKPALLSCLNYSGANPPDLDAITTALSTLAQNRPRPQSELSVVVSDHIMPPMLGLNLCAGIHNRFIQKVLLTGSDDELIDQALQSGLIHTRARKSDPNFPGSLFTYVKAAQRAYFLELTSFLITDELLDQHPELRFLQDARIASYVQQLYQERNLIAHFLIDSRTLQLQDQHGDAGKLTIKSKDESNADSHLVAYID